MVAKVIEQELFPSEVLKVRTKESSSKPKNVEVDPEVDINNTDVGTYDVTAPPPIASTGDALPTRINAPPTSLPLHNNNTNSQTHDNNNQVNNHII